MSVMSFIINLWMILIGYKIKEGNRKKVQAFEGTVIKKQGKGSRATFTSAEIGRATCRERV